MKALRKWLNLANPEEKQALAKAAGTTLGTLQNHAGNYRASGMKAGTAGKIAAASKKLNKRNSRLPILTRPQLCSDCSVCDYTKKRR